MKSVLIECRHLGQEFKRARKTAGIPRRDAAKMLGLDSRTLTKYECGKQPMPDSMTQRLAHYGYILLRAKYLTDTRKKSRQTAGIFLFGFVLDIHHGAERCLSHFFAADHRDSVEFEHAHF